MDMNIFFRTSPSLKVVDIINVFFWYIRSDILSTVARVVVAIMTIGVALEMFLVVITMTIILIVLISNKLVANDNHL